MYFAHLIVGLVLAVLPNDVAQHAAGQQQFVGSTPCDTEPRLFLGISRTVPCERITWHLTLAGSTERATFTVRVVYGIQVRNESGFEGGGSEKTVTGTWTGVSARTTHREAADYRLISDSPRRTLELRAVGDGLLHLLSRRGALMIGNGGWSYTLNRKDAPAVTRGARPPFEPVPARRTAAAGVFDGRTPCRELAGRLGTVRSDGCMKLKWRLTLLQDPVNSGSNRYVLEGTAYRNTPRRGTWTILTLQKDPRRLVYVLDAEDAERSLSLVRADDNILLFAAEDGSPLIGDADFSYTLNRVRGTPVRP